MSAEDPLLSFIIVNWNSGHLLEKCLTSVAQQSYRNIEVIIIDNGSTDGSCGPALGNVASCRIIRLSENTGFSHANNLGFASSRGEVVVLLNNDVELEPSWADEMLAVLARHPGAASVACRLLQQRDRSRLDSAGFAAYTCGSVYSWFGCPPEDINRSGYPLFGPVAAAAAYRRSALEETGLFHAQFFAYYEDTDLAFRLALHGHACCYAAEAVGHHLGSATGQRASDFHCYHLRRNVEYLYFINMQGNLVWRFLPAHILFEIAACWGMTLRGQGTVFLRAKIDAWRMRKWIFAERAKLRQLLSGCGKLAAGIQSLRCLLVPTRRLFLDRLAPPHAN